MRRIDLKRDNFSTRMHVKDEHASGLADVSMTIERALAEGHITQEELDELRSDTELPEGDTSSLYRRR